MSGAQTVRGELHTHSLILWDLFKFSYTFKEKHPVQITISEFRSNKDTITLKILKCLLFAALGSFLYVVLGLIQPHTWPQDSSERVQMTSWLLRDSQSFSQCRSNFSMEIKKWHMKANTSECKEGDMELFLDSPSSLCLCKSRHMVNVILHYAAAWFVFRLYFTWKRPKPARRMGEPRWGYCWFPTFNF